VAFDFLGVMTQDMWTDFKKFVDNCLADIALSDTSIKVQLEAESKRLLTYFKDLVRVDRFMQGKKDKQRIGDRSIQFPTEEKTEVFGEDIEASKYTKTEEFLRGTYQGDAFVCFYMDKIKHTARAHIVRKRETLEYQIKRCIDRIEFLEEKAKKLDRRVSLMPEFAEKIQKYFQDLDNNYTCLSTQDDLYTERGFFKARKSPTEVDKGDLKGKLS